MSYDVSYFVAGGYMPVRHVYALDADPLGATNPCRWAHPICRLRETGLPWTPDLLPVQDRDVEAALSSPSLCGACRNAWEELHRSVRSGGDGADELGTPPLF